ncbi:MAG TPA: tetratricopeptide repeat protein [Longimicrobiaceae bacterium]|jgi:tetratricopeptide (TPR) repeat protein|nr:tetratricopeptide repeat protein [Longimicrobiaceae bacterium]
MRISLRAAAVLALLACTSTVSAQAPAAPVSLPQQPVLPDTADANDWRSYYNAGVTLAQQPGTAARADDAFYWAGRLDPSRPEPLQGRWVTFWVRNQGLFFSSDPGVFRRPEVLANDSLRWRATLRNPFFSRDLDPLVYGRVAPFIRITPWLRSMLTFADGDYRGAAEMAGRALRSEQKQEMALREVRQLSFAAANQLDSARAETERMLALARARDEHERVKVYQGKELLAYELGLIDAAAGDLRGAREVLANALVENMAFYPAHTALGDVALATGDTATALSEYAQAVALAPDDPLVHFRYGGVLLLRTGRYADAAAQFRAASEAEPWWAEAYLNLGVALEASGDNDGALEAYRQFIAHAPRRMSESVARIRERIAALAPAGSAAPPSIR